MDYSQEQRRIKLNNFFKLLKTLIKKVIFISTAVIGIIILVLSINFFRYVVMGESTLSEFRNNFFGIPSNKLLKINHQIHDQHNSFKQWFADFKKRISK
jgi:hypothetical protein